MDADVSNLMMSMLSTGEQDDFGKEEGQRTILQLDRVMSSPKSHGSLLLGLPTEILADIVELRDRDTTTLSNLALVNVECRQLARSAQFADIDFNYSPSAHSLLDKLEYEATQRSDGIEIPSLGACVRRIVMCSHRGWVAAYHTELYESIFGDNPGTREQVQALKTPANSIYNAYRNRIIEVIRTAMPNMESVAWQDQFIVDDSLFRSISHTPIRHLKLSRTPIKFPCILQPPLSPASWPLRSLHLEARGPIDTEDSGDEDESGSDQSVTSLELQLKYYRPRKELNQTAYFVTSLLKLCASTLRSFHWVGDFSPNAKPISIGPLNFPRLQRFTSAFTDLAPDTLSTILRAPLRELQLPRLSTTRWAALNETLTSSEHLLDLQTLVIGHTVDDSAEMVAKFLKSTSHVQKLLIRESKAAGLDEHIVPTVSGGTFRNLVSLSMRWEGPGCAEETIPHISSIPEASLAAIGTIRNPATVAAHSWS